MKFTSQLILAASLLSLAACTESKKPENAEVGNRPVNFSTQSPQPQNAATTGTNPAHGQPGHRCDIPVGAPLNSPAQTNTAGVTASPAPVVTTPAPAASNTVAPGTNPPHGQPGHDCSIAVGAPLNQ